MSATDFHQSYVKEWHSMYTLICNFAIVISLFQFPQTLGYFFVDGSLHSFCFSADTYASVHVKNLAYWQYFFSAVYTIWYVNIMILFYENAAAKLQVKSFYKKTKVDYS